MAPFSQGADIWGEERDMYPLGGSCVGLKSVVPPLPTPLATHAVRPLHRGSSQLRLQHVAEERVCEQWAEGVRGAW